MNTKDHLFGPGDTVQAVLRKYNRHDMPQKFVDMLVIEFNKLNSERSKIPRVGDVFTIPIYDFTEEDLKTFPSKDRPEARPGQKKAPVVIDNNEFIIPDLTNIINMKDEEETVKEEEMKAILIRQDRREKARNAIEKGKALPKYFKTSKEIGKPTKKKKEKKPEVKKHIVEKKKEAPKTATPNVKEEPVKIIEKETPPSTIRKERPKRITKKPVVIENPKETPKEDMRIFHRKRPRRK